MNPVFQIFGSTILFFFTLIISGNLLMSDGVVTSALLVKVAVALSGIVISSFVISRILNWRLSR